MENGCNCLSPSFGFVSILVSPLNQNFYRHPPCLRKSVEGGEETKDERFTKGKLNKYNTVVQSSNVFFFYVVKEPTVWFLSSKFLMSSLTLKYNERNDKEKKHDYYRSFYFGGSVVQKL